MSNCYVGLGDSERAGTTQHKFSGLVGFRCLNPTYDATMLQRYYYNATMLIS